MNVASAGPVVLTIAILAATWFARRAGYTVPIPVAVPGALLAGVVVAVPLRVLGVEAALTPTVVLSLVTGVSIVWSIDRPQGAWAARLRDRFLMGVPWGTVLGILLVISVYLFLQQGIRNLQQPLSIPFTSWSYHYPLGIVTAPFSHANFGHLIGNLVGTVTLAPLAEYAFGHFPTRRGSSSFASWRTNPYVRAFVLFPLGILLVGLASSLFAWGAIIGFSGVVFAFAGFAILRYPFATVVALTARGVVSTIYYSLRDPVVVGSASPSYGAPWWVGIAVQGHLLGLFLGAILAVIIIGRRRERPSAARLFAGVTIAGFELTIWALWWYRGPASYVLYRGLGVVLVVTVAVGLATAIRATDRPIGLDVTRRQIAIAVVLLPLLTMAMVAVPVNSTTVTSADAPQDAIEVRDYTVYYAEDVPHRRVSSVDIELLNESTSVNASGVIVTSDKRHVWTEAVSTGSLGFWGEQSVRVGGVGWMQTIDARRIGWRPAGAPPVYNVYLAPPEENFSHVYASEARTADPTIAGRNVTFVPTEAAFRIRVTDGNRTLGEAPIPSTSESVTVGDIAFVRQNETLQARYNGTRIRIGTTESYE